jgi:DNA polymerase/3'-5' exonuclease PolX
MQGHSWREAKIKRPRAVIEPHLRLLLSQFVASNPEAPPDLHVVGSWRRGADPVGDIDLVIVTPSGEMTADLMSPGVRLPTLVEWSRHGARQAHGSIHLHDGTDCYVDVWCCAPDELGPHLVFASGPMPLNAAMRAHCKRNGKALSQRGVYNRETRQRLDDGTERGVFEAADWRWLEPEDRQKWANR